MTPSEFSPSISSYAPSESSRDEAPDLREVEEPSEADFLWMTTEEPHRSRRMAILAAHPEVSCQ